MNHEIEIASADMLIEEHGGYPGDWVSKIKSHFEYIFGSNYDVSTNADLPIREDIEDMDNRCDIAGWYASSDYTTGTKKVPSTHSGWRRFLRFRLHRGRCRGSSSPSRPI